MTTPTILPQVKLEPRTKKQEFDVTLQGAVHDGLWMLTQQYRSGEFNGEDAASPIFAKIDFGIRRINKFKSGVAPFNLNLIDDKIPMEPYAEQLPFYKDFSVSVQAGTYLLKLLNRSSTPNISILKDEIKAFGPYQIEKNIANQNLAQQTNFEENAFRAGSKGLLLDGVAIYKSFKSATSSNLPNLLTTPLNTFGGFAAEVQAYISYFEKMYLQPDVQKFNSNWDQKALEYKFLCATQVSDTDPHLYKQDLVLDAIDYGGGKLDWYDFDMRPDDTLGQGFLRNPESYSNLYVVKNESMEFIPSPLEFKGMPTERWWQFEDKNIDYGALKDTYAPNKKSNYALLSILNFGLNYSNDWFMVPYKLTKGTLVNVFGLTVRNVIDPFPINVTLNNGSWRVFNMNWGDNIASEKFNFFPHVLPTVQESEPLEKVVFMRDEMANTVWGIEKNVPDGLGGSVDGFALQQRTQDHLFNLLNANQSAAITGADFDFNAAETNAKLEYKIMNSIPENWIPFIPKPDPSDNSIRLQRATLNRVVKDKYISNIEDEHYIRPRTPLLSEGLEKLPQQTLFFNEEEILRDGVVITTNYQRVRWYDGRTFVWMGRKKTVGYGEGDSKLRFDKLS